MQNKLVIGTTLLFIIVSIPLLMVRMPPLMDLPNHLARFHILRTIDLDPYLQQYYRAN